MSVSIIAIDIAKNVFQVVGVDRAKRPVFEHRFRRQKLEIFMTRQAPARVVMEACYMAHYWGRRFEAMGHRVQLIPPQHVKPFVRGNKNDSNDALAIAEAADRPHLRFVPIKTEQQQEVLALHRIRERLKGQRVQLMNQTRGLLAEFGVVFPLGHAAFTRALIEVVDKQRISPRFAGIVMQLREEYLRLSEQLTLIDQEIAAGVAATPDCQILTSIPGVGPLIASGLVASIDRGQAFSNPRQFAVWLGLTPKQSASGDRERMGGITKRGDRYLRTLFIHGARSVIRWSRHRNDALSRWARAVVARRGIHKATVAVAHKLARLSWVLLQRQTAFEPR
jgi:transposase